MIELRPYQVEIGRAILDSVVHRKGLTFSVEIARQGGKNELSAQVEMLLLTLFMGAGGSAVKASPTFKPQTVNSMLRLKDRLDGAGYAGVWQPEMGYIIKLGRARQFFFSADKAAGVVGATADILLEIDESLDVGKEKYNKEFKPMGAATNVTTVHYGTTWDEATLLEEVKQTNLELEKRTGIRRHFRYDWREVGKYNPDYLNYAEGERQRLGEDHPLFLTQYALLPVRGGGGLLTATQMSLLQGGHSRLRSPAGKGVFVAGIDVGGVGTEETKEDGRDATVVTIGEVELPATGDLFQRPKVLVREHYRKRGMPHPQLHRELYELLKGVWGCRKVVIDATGPGMGLASFLRSSLGSRVVPFIFTEKSKSNLGFDLLAAVNSGSLKMYRRDGSPEFEEFWKEMGLARSAFRRNETMAFDVPPEKGHDDFLMSLALVVEAAKEYEPRTAKGDSKIKD